MSDDDSKIELNRRRVLGGIVTVGAAAAAAGAGTFAAFSDTEESNNNQVKAGTLNLMVNDKDSSVSALTVENAVPGEGGSETLTIKNEGSVNGTLDVSIDQISSGENETNDPESNAPGESSGVVELESKLTVTISVGSGGDSLVSDTVNNLSTGSIGTTPLNGQSSKDLIIEYSIDSGAGNEIQSDKVTLDLAFTLES